MIDTESQIKHMKEVLKYAYLDIGALLSEGFDTNTKDVLSGDLPFADGSIMEGVHNTLTEIVAIVGEIENA